MTTYSDRPATVGDEYSRATHARQILWPAFGGYTAVALGIIAWAMVRPDHTYQIVAIMADVIVTPSLALAAVLNGARMPALVQRHLASWVLGDDPSAWCVRLILKPFVVAYVAVAWGLIAWAIVRPDHTYQIMAVMTAVITLPFAALLRQL